MCGPSICIHFSLFLSYSFQLKNYGVARSMFLFFSMHCNYKLLFMSQINTYWKQNWKTVIIFEHEHLPVPLNEIILTFLWRLTRHLKSHLYHCVISRWLWVNNTGWQQLEVQHTHTQSHSLVVMLKECRLRMRYSNCNTILSV